jgi:hypothetical protein
MPNNLQAGDLAYIVSQWARPNRQAGYLRQLSKRSTVRLARACMAETAMLQKQDAGTACRAPTNYGLFGGAHEKSTARQITLMRVRKNLEERKS